MTAATVAMATATVNVAVAAATTDVGAELASAQQVLSLV